jgi:predicted ribosome quality control (RQC) complex YloA/Tae2 family protein
MRLTSAHVAELAAELAPLLCGRRVARVAARPPRTLGLVLEDPQAPAGGRGPRSRAELVLCADPDLPRLWLTSPRTSADGPVGPFFQRALREMEGARLSVLAAQPGERVVRLRLEDTPAGEPRWLVLELFGRNATLVLLDRAERVLIALDPPQEPIQDAARLRPGALWSLPPRAATGRAAPQGAALPTLRELARDANVPLDHPTPCSAFVEQELGRLAERTARARAATDLRKRLERAQERARSTLAGLEARRSAGAQAERVRQDGELLLAHLRDLARGQRSVRLPDSFQEGAPPRELELDPARSPQENARAYFERYKKLARGAARVESELALARAKALELEGLLAELAQSDSDPFELEQRASSAGLLVARASVHAREREPVRQRPRLPYRTFLASSGSEIRVGRSASDNDELTLRHARGNDLWLHTADAPGSHVVLRLEGGAEPTQEDLLDAAHLAVHFSPLRERARAQVHVARVKQVHKPRGAKPGLVTLSGGKHLSLRLEPARLERLLASRAQPGEQA